MSVTVGGREPVPGPSAPRRWAVKSLIGLVLVGGATVIASTAGDPLAVSPTEVERVPVLDTGRWISAGSHGSDPFDARPIAGFYVYLTEDRAGVERIGPDGRTSVVSLGPGATPLRLTSDGKTAVIWGTDHGRTALWVSSDGQDWKRRLLPWNGTVQAVAIRPEGLVILGIDRDRDRQVVATEFESGWAVAATDAPPTGLRSTGTAMLGRGRGGDGDVAYLASVDGRNWIRIGAELSLNVGDVAIFEGEGKDRVLRLPESGRIVRPPEWPVAALWDTGDRIWLQTPSAVWWSADGERWSPLRLTSDLGVESGSPVLLPFEDRALLSVGGARGSARQLLVWILGT